MSLALYRKYRPATFAELKGQEHVAEPLQQALRNGRINHAYLFSGPRGCGKTSSARILARSLNCELGPTPDPCGKCDSCVALGPSGSGHIDVIEIDAASHGGVDDARDLRERAFFAPVQSRFKIYIIDEAHMVTKDGFNALLKLVEEPPPHLKFIFATTEPEKVLSTIRSRTHHYPFRLIPPGVLRELLEEILSSENVPFEPAALPLVVRAGAGSARDSLSILDQLLAGSDDAGITYARAVSLLGYTDSSLLDEVVDAFAAKDGAAVFGAVDRVIESGQDPRRFTADLLERVRDLVILANVPEAASSGLLDAPRDDLERMRRQAATAGRGELTRAADLLHTGLTEMRGATSPRLLLELICARILLPGAYDDEASLLARLERLERRAAAGGLGSAPAQHAPAQQHAPVQPVQPVQQPTPVPEHAAVQQVAPARRAQPARQAASAEDWPAVSQAPQGPQAPQGSRQPVQAPPRNHSSPPAGGPDVNAVRQAWPQIMESVRKKSRVAGIYMEGVQILSLEGTVLTLGFTNEGHRKAFSGRDGVIRESLKEHFGVEWRVEAVQGSGGSAPVNRPAPPQRPAAQQPQAPNQTPAPRPEPKAVQPPRQDARPAQASRPEQAWEPPPPPDGPQDEAFEVDPEGDADAGADEITNGMALIQKELGGEIIKEIDNS
jgi:DNA polymerase III subunit gamma/tau